VLDKVLKGSDIDFGKEVIPHSIRKFKAFGYVFNGYWKDIGTIKSFYDANIDMASYKPHFNFLYEGSVFTRPRFLPPARIANCKLERSLIAEGSVITDAEINDSVIGLRSIIGRGCRISKSVLMGADYYEPVPPKGSKRLGIGDGTVINGAIIDKNARIGKKVLIKNLKNLKNFDGDSYFIRDGIVIIPKNGVIADGTKI
jgi:glucose-1-phosphate adenylyltransferase